MDSEGVERREPAARSRLAGDTPLTFPPPPCAAARLGGTFARRRGGRGWWPREGARLLQCWGARGMSRLLSEAAGAEPASSGLGAGVSTARASDPCDAGGRGGGADAAGCGRRWRVARSRLAGAGPPPAPGPRRQRSVEPSRSSGSGAAGGPGARPVRCRGAPGRGCRGWLRPPAGRRAGAAGYCRRRRAGCSPLAARRSLQ